MKKEPRPASPLGRKVLLASAISLSMVAAPSLAATEAQAATANQPKFQSLDKNSDRSLEWNEIDRELGDRINKAGWNEEAVLGQYDKNRDRRLSQDEYLMFIVALEEQEKKQTANVAQQRDAQNAEVVVQSQQPRISVDTQPPQVQVDQAKPNVQVDQKAAQVQVDQDQPKVSVDQQKPKVIVRQPEPEVSVTNPEPKVDVNIPEPEVTVIQPDPNVNVEQAKPQVQVKQPKPEVSVTQSKPEVTVDQRAPEVAVQPARPEVVLDDDTGQAQVDVERSSADVNVQSSDPQVSVNQADPSVNVQEAEGANVNIRDAEPEVAVQQQDATQRQQDDAAIATDEDFDPENLPATAAGTPPEQNMDMSGIYEVSINELEGKDIVNLNGESIGEVDRVVASRDMSKLGLVVSVGGFLGTDLGDTDVMVPVENLQIVEDKLVLQSSLTKQQLKQDSSYNPQDYLRVEADRFNNLREVQSATRQ